MTFKGQAEGPDSPVPSYLQLGFELESKEGTRVELSLPAPCPPQAEPFRQTHTCLSRIPGLRMRKRVTQEWRFLGRVRRLHTSHTTSLGRHSVLSNTPGPLACHQPGPCLPFHHQHLTVGEGLLPVEMQIALGEASG